ncbi:TonB-dependent vitamin B12 receptor [Kistimonas scapharcae]|uniref:TonB-dependent vitamin B12 receptor n=1 Tax=Kistimonas scapharcae TaxID=1036133 RepID=A0ABP8V2Q2_9GAMM
MTKPSALALLPLAIMAANVHADDVYEMDNVVVTASRTAQTIDETLAPVTVISRKDIEQSQASSVPELLKRVPGMQVSTSGGAGSTTSIYLRGTKTAQTLVLLDGHRIDSATSGSASLQIIDPDMIERIEVVRGPRSSLYGADAVGGVIQIFTRKGHSDPRLTLKIGAGSHGTNQYGLNYGGKVGGTNFNIGGKFFETEGYDNTSSKSNYSGDDDAYRNKSFTASVSHTFDNNVEAGVNILHSEGKNEYDSSYYMRPYDEFRFSTINAFLNIPVNDNWTTRLTTGYSNEMGENFQRLLDGTHKKNGSIKSMRNTASWLNDIAWADNQLLTAGIDYSNDRVDTKPNSYEVDSRYNKAVFVQNQSSFENSNLQVGLRRDKNEAFGYKTTGNISWGVNLTDNYRLITSYGTAFRAPTMMDLYYPGSESPDLKPEKSKNAEVELRGNLSQVSHWSVAVFQNDMDDMLLWDGVLRRVNNIEKARIRGIEATFSTQMAAWDITASATYLDPKNLSDNEKTKDKVLQRRARQLLSLDADRAFGRFSFGGTVRAQGKSYDDAENEDRLSGFVTVDLRTAYRFSSELKGELKLANLMDKEYQTALGYQGEPRGVFVSMTWTPEI